MITQKEAREKSSSNQLAAELVVQGLSLAPLWVVIGLLMRILIRILSGILIRILIKDLIMTHQGSREQPGNHQLASELVVLAAAPDPPRGGHQDPLEPVILYFLLTVTDFLYFFYTLLVTVTQNH